MLPDRGTDIKKKDQKGCLASKGTTLSIKPHDLSLITGYHILEGENQVLKASLTSSLWHAPAHINPLYTKSIKEKIKEQ